MMLFNHGSSIQVDTNRCLNQQHNSVECSHCVSHCSGQALILSNHQIYLNKEKCLGCGMCFADCPTQVFGSNQWDETTIRTEVEYQEARVTQVFCGRHDTPFLSKKDEEKGAVQIPTCLSSISKGVWYDIGLLTAVELRLDECPQCPMNSCIGRMQKAVGTAMEWLTASGHIADFSYIYTAEKVKKKKKLQAVSSGLKVTSRRDLFLTLTGHRHEADLKIGVEASSHETKEKQRENYLPDWQKRLGESYAINFVEGGSPAYWPSIQMNTNCVNCGVCSAYCPTQALQIKVEDGRVKHQFTSGYCLDCRICRLSCPTQSITRDRQLTSNPFQVKTIYQAPLAKCRRCGSNTFTNEQNLCYWCQKEPPKQEMISEVRLRLLEKKV